MRESLPDLNFLPSISSGPSPVSFSSLNTDVAPVYGHPTLLKLPNEILCMILCFCEVVDVLRLERTCTLLHRLAQTRLVWFTLLRSLPLTYCPNTPPHIPLSAYTAPQIRSVVINAVRGHHNWRRKDGPNVTREVSFAIRMPRDEEGGDELGLRGQDERAEPRMVSGGKWVVVNNCGRLEVWDISGSAVDRNDGVKRGEGPKGAVQIWKDDAYKAGVEVLSFDFEARSENEMVIAGVFLNTRNSSPTVRVFQFKADSEEPTANASLIMERSLPVVFLFRLAVRDDYVLVHMPYPSQIILMNWKERTTLVVDFQDPHGKKLSARAALISQNHLIAALNADSFSLIALPLSILNSPAVGPWSTDRNYDTWPHYTYNPEDSSGMLIRLPNFDVDEGPWVLAMHVFEPTWRGGNEARNVAEVLLVAYGRILGSGRKKKFLSYHARIAKGSEAAEHAIISHSSSIPGNTESPSYSLSLFSSSCTPATSLPWNPLSLSNSGRMCAIRDTLVCFSTLCNDEPQPISSSSVVTPWSKIIGDLGPGGGAEFGISGSGVSPGDAVVLEVDPTSGSIEPWSGALVIGMPGRVRILWFD